MFFWNRITPGMLGLELTTLLAVAAVQSYVFFALGSYVGDHAPFRIDTNTLRFAGDIRGETLTDIAKVVTTLGRFWVVGPIVAVFATLAGGAAVHRRGAHARDLARRRLSIATQIAKATVDRPRARPTRWSRPPAAASPRVTRPTRSPTWRSRSCSCGWSPG